MFTKLLDFILGLFKGKETVREFHPKRILKPNMSGDDVKDLQECLLILKLFHGTALGNFGPLTTQAVEDLQALYGLTVDGIVGPQTVSALNAALRGGKVDPKNTPVYPSPHKFHPRFDSKLKAPYTHIHPIDVLRSVAGEKEIPGKQDNPLIAHFHEHSGNLGKHDDHNDYSDEVAHCSSALNWAADMAGCAKTNNALAASWSSYGNPRQGDWVEEGDVIHKKTGSQNHVTLCNKRFNRKTAKNYEGFGSNQGNTIKTTVYPVSDIVSVQVWKPLPGTKLAPIGILGMKPTPATGNGEESTR